MTVYQLLADGNLDCAIDVHDPQPWVEASRLMHLALQGRPVEVTAVPTPGLDVCVDLVPFDWVKTVTADA